LAHRYGRGRRARSGRRPRPGDELFGDVAAAADPAVGGAPRAGDAHKLSIPDPYARQLAFLQNKLLWTQAHDGGRLTPEHAQALQRQLDALNRSVAGSRPD
jgi:hypothetical protein